MRSKCISLFFILLSYLLLPAHAVSASKNVKGWEKLHWGDDIEKVQELYQEKIEIPAFNEKRRFPASEEKHVTYVMRNYKISGINFDVYFLQDQSQRLSGVCLLTGPNDFIFKDDFDYVAKIMIKKYGQPTRTGDHVLKDYDYYRRIWSFESTEIELAFFIDREAQNFAMQKRLGLSTSGIYNTNIKIAYYNIEQPASNVKEALARAKKKGELAEGKFLYEVTLSDASVFFAFDKANLSNRAVSALDLFARRFKHEDKEHYCEIQGNTDSFGTEKYNLNLGRARAEAVMHYLHNNHDISYQRMSTISYGETRPIADNITEEGRSKNRRVSIVVMK